MFNRQWNIMEKFSGMERPSVLARKLNALVAEVEKLLEQGATKAVADKKKVKEDKKPSQEDSE